MREIKFRVWDVDEGHWYENKNFPYQLIDNEGKFHWADYYEWGPYPNDVVICQYTGLKDKNGVEIYFGDIYESFTRIIETDYGDSGIGESGYPENIYIAHQEVRDEFEKGAIKDWDDVLALGIYDTIEVIGNIHEHPHLLLEVD